MSGETKPTAPDGVVAWWTAESDVGPVAIVEGQGVLLWREGIWWRTTDSHLQAEVYAKAFEAKRARLAELESAARSAAEFLAKLGGVPGPMYARILRAAAGEP